MNYVIGSFVLEIIIVTFLLNMPDKYWNAISESNWI